MVRIAQSIHPAFSNRLTSEAAWLLCCSERHVHRTEAKQWELESETQLRKIPDLSACTKLSTIDLHHNLSGCYLAARISCEIRTKV